MCQVQESTQQLSMLWQQKNSLEEQLLCNETVHTIDNSDACALVSNPALKL